MTVVDLSEVPVHRGGQVLLERALAAVPVGGSVEVVGADLADVRVWCRARGHALRGAVVVRAADGRFVRALASGHPDPSREGAVAAAADPKWGLAARGARVEDGPPELVFAISDAAAWWAGAPRLYAQAAAAQWDPEAAVPWHLPMTHAREVEEAVVQLMTYLVENETAALLVPSRFIGSIHPHYREVVAFLATQVADEARHAAVFSRRASLYLDRLGTSSRSGQASLATLVQEPDFDRASLLLTVMGEASFLEILRFLQEVAPDPITRTLATLAAADEARHVAFAVGHLRARCADNPSIREALAAAIRSRAAGLRHSAGLNEDVFDALVVLAAGGCTPARVSAGFDRVQRLIERMDRVRRAHLGRLGFTRDAAAELSALHTQNFM